MCKFSKGIIAMARGLTLQESLIPLASELMSDDYQYITQTKQVSIGGGNTKKHEAEILMVENSQMWETSYEWC